MVKRIQNEQLSSLVRLVHHRWTVPLIAELHRLSGAKFVTLSHRLGMSRSSLSSALSELTALGLVRKNPGHGHPMRPEYVLTERGREIGASCMQLVDRIDADGDLAFRKWTLPLVASIGDRVARFGDVREALAVATPRAIATGLKTLQRRDWITRKVLDDYPPTAGYRLNNKGLFLLPDVTSLSRAASGILPGGH